MHLSSKLYLYLPSTVASLIILWLWLFHKMICCLPDHWQYDLDTARYRHYHEVPHSRPQHELLHTLCWVVCLCGRSRPVLVYCNEVAGAEVVRGKGCEIASRATTTLWLIGSLNVCVCVYGKDRKRKKRTFCRFLKKLQKDDQCQKGSYRPTLTWSVLPHHIALCPSQVLTPLRLFHQYMMDVFLRSSVHGQWFIFNITAGTAVTQWFWCGSISAAHTLAVRKSSVLQAAVRYVKWLSEISKTYCEAQKHFDKNSCWAYGAESRDQ